MKRSLKQGLVMNKLLGLNELLNYNLYLRGVLLTLYAIILFRASSSRLYGNYSPLDFVIYILIGEILGETIMSNAPVLSAVIVCALIIGTHHFLSYLCYKNHSIGAYIKGKKVEIIKNGKYLEKNIRCCQLTHNDILQALRVQHGMKNIDKVREAILERDGQISFILKENNI
jgi:uncharacterized membrane protein YcaP (DUF421 family)